MNQRNDKNGIHVHIDADAFFASVEQVLHRELKDKPVAVGQNGGIVTALSYPAKDLGVSRVEPIVNVRRMFPGVKIVASDFNAYGIFSKRMDRIIRNRFPNLVKNSIDEGSIDMGSSVSSFNEAIFEIKKLEEELQLKLNCGFSFGIARTPLLAKLASGMEKPNGITVLTDENIKEKIYHFPANRLSGIGTQGYKKLQNNCIYTIGDFAEADPEFLEKEFSVVMPALQDQVLGYAVDLPKQKEGVKSMSRDRSFPKTSSYSFLESQMSMNIEHLSNRLRSEDLYANRVGLLLRDSNMNFVNSYENMFQPTREPQEVLKILQKVLRRLYRENILYTQVSVTFAGLQQKPRQQDLFGEAKKSESKDNIFVLIDGLEKKFGKACIGLASSMRAVTRQERFRDEKVKGDTYPHDLLPGEEVDKRLNLPYLGKVF